MGIKSTNYDTKVGVSTSQLLIAESKFTSTGLPVTTVEFNGSIYPTPGEFNISEFGKYNIDLDNIVIPDIESGGIIADTGNPITDDIYGAWYANGYWVVCGSDNLVAYSTDGKNWKINKPDLGDQTRIFNTIKYLPTNTGGIWVTVGEAGTIAFISDITSTNWDYRINIGLSVNLTDIIYEQERYAICSSNGYVFYTDSLSASQYIYYQVRGINSSGVATTGIWQRIVFNGGYYILAGGNNSYAYFESLGSFPPVGSTWTSVYGPGFSSGTVLKIYYSDLISSNIIIGDGNGLISRSDTYPPSFPQTSYGTGAFNDLHVINDSRHLIIGKNIYVYDDGSFTNWTTNPLTFAANRIASNGEEVIIVGMNGTIAYSEDLGTTFTIEEKNIWNDITYSGGRYLIVGNDGYYAYSEDGIEWTTSTVGTQNNLSTLYINGYYLIGSEEGLLHVSQNLVTWTSYRPSGLPGDLSQSITNIIYDGTNAIISTFSGTIYWSSTYQTVSIWNSNAVTNGNISTLNYGNGIYTFFDSTNKLLCYNSKLTGTWTTYPLESDSTPVGGINVRSITYGNGNWIAVGFDGWIAYTQNITGTTNSNGWEFEHLAPGFSLNDVTYNSGKNQFVIVGDHVLITGMPDNFNVQQINNTLNAVYADGNTILGVGNNAFYINSMNYGEYAAESTLVRRYTILPGEMQTFVGYDYNTNWITDIGDRRLNNYPIRSEVMNGMLLSSTLYDITYAQSKIFNVYHNDEFITSSSIAGSSPIFWFSTALLELNDGDTITIEAVTPQETFSQTFEAIGVEEACNYRYVIYYVNKYGNVDALIMKGEYQEYYNNDRFIIDTNYDRNSPSSHQYKVVQNTALKYLTLNTGALTDSQSELMDHLRLTPKMWIHDMETGLIYAAYVDQPSFTVNKLVVNNEYQNNYQFDVVIAQDVIRRG